MASYGDHIDGLSVRELRELIASAVMSHTDCLEKEDLRVRARQAREKLQGSGTSAGGGSKKRKNNKKKKKVAAAPAASSSSSASLSSSSFTSRKGPSAAGASSLISSPCPPSSSDSVRQVLPQHGQVGPSSSRPKIHVAEAAAVATAFPNAGGQGISRDVAKAAGIDWGSDPIPARMVELQRRHDALVDIAEAAKLTLHDIKDHNEYLAGLTKQIAEEGEAMKRKFRLATAQAVRSTNPKRAAQHESAAKAIQRRQTSFNKEVSMTQTEVDWLKQSPAYSQAMEFLDAHWIKTKRGDYVSKQDLRDDQETTFEDMLAQMKLEGNQPPSDSLDDGEGGLTAEEIAEALGSTKR